MKRVGMIAVVLMAAGIVSLTSGYTLAATESDSAARPVPVKAEAVQPILVGQTFPKVVLKGADGAAVDFATVLAEKPSVLIFYRGDW